MVLTARCSPAHASVPCPGSLVLGPCLTVLSPPCCPSGNLDKQTGKGSTALHYCCLTDNAECLKLLLRGKASIEIGESACTAARLHSRGAVRTDRAPCPLKGRASLASPRIAQQSPRPGPSTVSRVVGVRAEEAEGIRQGLGHLTLLLRAHTLDLT